MVSEERRSFPRISDKNFAMELRLGEFDTVVHTLNVSASGAYCKIDREIPLMSRVKLELMMPRIKKGDTAKGLEVSGVVVRQHPVIIDGERKHYDIAIFFDDIAPEDRQVISDYLAKKNL